MAIVYGKSGKQKQTHRTMSNYKVATHLKADICITKNVGF